MDGWMHGCMDGCMDWILAGNSMLLNSRINDAVSFNCLAFLRLKLPV